MNYNFIQLTVSSGQENLNRRFSTRYTTLSLLPSGAYQHCVCINGWCMSTGDPPPIVKMLIFAQKSQLVSRAVILQGTLVSVLREVGFFRSATIWADEKPGTFKPFQLSLQEERKRYLELNQGIPCFKH